MMLEPFSRINPCGYQGLQVIDLASLGVEISADALEELLVKVINDRLQAG
jgi:lipoyl(octanoyl) transferase